MDSTAAIGTSFGPANLVPIELADPTALPDFQTLLNDNIKAATTAVQEAARELRPEDLKLYKNADGSSSYKIPPEAETSINFWERVRSNPEYAKALYSAHDQLSKGALSGKPLMSLVKQPNGDTAQVAITADGSVNIVARTAAEENALKNNAIIAEQRLTTNALLADFSKVIQATTGAVDRARIKSEGANAALLASLGEVNATMGAIYGGQAAVQDAVVTAKLAAGEAKANNAEARITALLSAPGIDNVKKIWEDTTARHIDLMAKEKTAQANLDKINANPFYSAASILSGGPDKNPVVIGAKATLEQLTVARNNAQVTANAVLTGMGQMQQIIDKSFLVETPTEIRAAAAEDAAKFSAAAAKNRALVAELPVKTAELTAKIAEAGFKDTLATAQLQLQGNQALLAAATGSEKIALGEENARLRKYIADEGNKTKLDIAEMKSSMGVGPEQTLDIAAKYFAIRNNTGEAPTVKEAYEVMMQGVKVKDPMLNKLRDWTSGVTPNSVQKWRELAGAASVRSGLAKAFPAATLAITPTENGYSKWANLELAQEELVANYSKSKLDKANEKADRPIAELAAQKMLVTSQRSPEAPLTANINGKDVKVAAPNPWKVYPGAFLSTTAEGNNSGLSAELKAELASNPIAVSAAELEAKYAMLPKTGGAKRTVGVEDILTLALEKKAADPSLTTQQAARWISDIYAAGVQLNNKYVAPEVFGLPKQESYPLVIEKDSIGASILRRVSNFTQDAADFRGGIYGIPTMIEDARTAGAATRGREFRKNFKDAFTGLTTTEKVDMLKPNDIVMMLTRSNPDLWGNKK